VVKIYKVIGMSLKDKNGKLVMIDDARFDPIIDFIVKKQYSFIEEYFRLLRIMIRCSGRTRNDLLTFTLTPYHCSAFGKRQNKLERIQRNKNRGKSYL